MRKLLSILCTFCTISLSAQFFDSKNYDWDEALYEKVTVDDSTDLYIILDKEVFNFYYNDNSLEEEYLYHRKLFVNSDDAIEGLNKIYIAQSKDDLIQFKARSISPAGKIIEITEDKILKGVDEDSEREYVYFAMEGLEVGSQVEYFYIKKIEPGLNGVSREVQGYFPIKRSEIDVITPWNLVMASKTYNLKQNFETDTTLEEQNRIYFRADSIEPMEDEPNSFRDAHLGWLVFKLDQNLYTGKKNIVAYSHIAQNVVNNINGELSRKDEKTLEKIEKAIAKFEPEIEVSKARKIENYLKSNFQFVDVGNPVLSEIASINENKAFNQLGGLRLYTRLFKRAGIDYKIVYTSDRSELPFDPDFESNMFLDAMLIYVVEDDDYMDITDPLSRLGYVSDQYTSNHGLFIEEMQLNDNVVGVSTTEFIPAKGADFTIDSMEINVLFADDLFDNNLDIKRVLSGYTAAFYQPLLSFIRDEDSKKEFRESLLKYINSEAEVADLTIDNGNGNMLGVKPLVARGKLESASFVEKAGNNYLFKVGTLIGPQVEMYADEGERKLDVESDHARTYIRKIVFSVPEGYEVSGLEDLKMDVKLMYKEEVSSRFESDYSVDGDIVTVSILEYYNEVHYPKEIFEEYREVINAAADFNKKTLLLKKAG